MSNPNVRIVNNNPGGNPVFVKWEIFKNGGVSVSFPDRRGDFYGGFSEESTFVINAMFPNGYQEWTTEAEEGVEVQP